MRKCELSANSLDRTLVGAISCRNEARHTIRELTGTTHPCLAACVLHAMQCSQSKSWEVIWNQLPQED